MNLDKPEKIGLTVIEYGNSKSILTEGKGFLDLYDYVINPYQGRSFGCTYCYAAAFTPPKMTEKTWGEWLIVKENSLELLKKSKDDLSNKSIYISSVTDPYQPSINVIGARGSGKSQALAVYVLYEQYFKDDFKSFYKKLNENNIVSRSW